MAHKVESMYSSRDLWHEKENSRGFLDCIFTHIPLKIFPDFFTSFSLFQRRLSGFHPNSSLTLRSL